MKRYNLAPGDFPDLETFKAKLAESDFSKFSSLRQNLIDEVEKVLGSDLPRFMDALPRIQSAAPAPNNGPLQFDEAGGAAPAAPAKPSRMSQIASVRASVATAVVDNPWGADDDDVGADWELQEYVTLHQASFKSVQRDGFVTGAAAKPVLTASGLPSSTLRKIWDLSDIDRDGALDLEEFVVAMALIDMIKGGTELPAALDPRLVPPSKRHLA